MKTITDKSVHSEVLSRLEKLQASTIAKWGSMNATQMLWHCRQQIYLTNGKLVVKNMFPAPIRWVLKNTFGKKFPFGKGMATLPGIEAAQLTNLNFEEEKKGFIKDIDDFLQMPAASLPNNHPIFGSMTPKEWGEIIYKHIDHHFRQFDI